MASTQGMFKLVPAYQQGVDPGQKLVEVTRATFVTTAVSLELVTNLTRIDHIDVRAIVATPDAQDTFTSDYIITAGAVTIFRQATGTSGLTISVVLTGTVD